MVAQEMAEIVAESFAAGAGAAEVCRRHGVPPAEFNRWRRRFVDAGKRELAGIGGGEGGGDPAGALAGRNRALEALTAEQALVIAELEKGLRMKRERARRAGRRPAAEAAAAGRA